MRVAVLTFLRTVLVLHPRVTSYNRLIKRVGQDWLGRVAARADVRALKTRNAVDRPWPASRRSSQMMIDIEQHSVTLLPEFAGRTRQDAEAPLTTLTSASRSQLASVCVPTAWDRSATGQSPLSQRASGQFQRTRRDSACRLFWDVLALAVAHEGLVHDGERGGGELGGGELGGGDRGGLLVNADSPGRAPHRHQRPGSAWHVRGDRAAHIAGSLLAPPTYRARLPFRGAVWCLPCAGRRFSTCAAARCCHTTCAPSRRSSGGQWGSPGLSMACCARTCGARSVRWWPGRRIRARRRPSWRCTRSSGWRWAAVAKPRRTSKVRTATV